MISRSELTFFISFLSHDFRDKLYVQWYLIMGYQPQKMIEFKRRLVSNIWEVKVHWPSSIQYQIYYRMTIKTFLCGSPYKYHPSISQSWPQIEFLISVPKINPIIWSMICHIESAISNFKNLASNSLAAKKTLK